MNKDKICGIYCIENLVNGKKYVGQSVNINKRWSEHLRTLNKGNHKNRILLAEYKRYGKENFKFILLEKTNSSDLNEREVYWIEFFDSYSLGYNMTHGGDINPMTYEPIKEKCRKKLLGNKNWLGKRHSTETKKIMSEQAKGRKLSTESREKISKTRIELGLGGQYGNKNPLSKKVNQIDINTGKIMNTYESMNMAKIKLNGHASGIISRVLSDKCRNKTAFGYYWEYA